MRVHTILVDGVLPATLRFSLLEDAHGGLLAGHLAEKHVHDKLETVLLVAKDACGREEALPLMSSLCNSQRNRKSLLSTPPTDTGRRTLLHCSS